MGSSPGDFSERPSRDDSHDPSGFLCGNCSTVHLDKLKITVYITVNYL